MKQRQEQGQQEGANAAKSARSLAKFTDLRGQESQGGVLWQRQLCEIAGQGVQPATCCSTQQIGWQSSSNSSHPT